MVTDAQAAYVNSLYQTSYSLTGNIGIDPALFASGALQAAVNGTPAITSPGYAPNGGIGVGPVSPGAQIPGGTAGFAEARQRAATQGASWLSGLSHLTGGLTWSHLVLWLAILLGGYLVIEHFAGGKRGRRR
jgi:hypothetical protein